MIKVLSGHVGKYDVFVIGVEGADDKVIVIDEDRIVTRQRVAGLWEFIEEAQDLKLGWAELSDFDVVYLYDKGDDYFGYAVNLEEPAFSEWGYAPFVEEEFQY
jgi:hypothetical protein